MILTFVSAVAVAALVITMWADGDTLATAVLGVTLAPLLVLAILALRELL